MPSECPRCHCYTVKYHDCEQELREQAEREKNHKADPKVKARFEGAKAAQGGLKMDANTYPETDDLHFEWLAAWTDMRLAMHKSRHNAEVSRGDGSASLNPNQTS